MSLLKGQQQGIGRRRARHWQGVRVPAPCTLGRLGEDAEIFGRSFRSTAAAIRRRPASFHHQVSFVHRAPHTSAPFKYRGHVVTRTGFPFSPGRVVTATACQGRTMHGGVVVDCGRHTGGATPKNDEDWWLDLYVMLSRATRLEDLLLVRPPPSDFLL